MKFKSVKPLLLLFIFLILLYGCQSKNISKYDNFRASDFVELFDYTQISIDKNDLTVPEEDIESVILFDLQSNCYFKNTNKTVAENGDVLILKLKETVSGESLYSDEFIIILNSDAEADSVEFAFNEALTNASIGQKISFNVEVENENGEISIIEYEAEIKEIQELITELDNEIVELAYGYTDTQIAKEAFKEKIISGRIFDIITEQTIQNSKISNYPQQKDEYLNSIKTEIEKSAKSESLSVDDYCNDLYGLCYNDYISSLCDFYDEYTIVKAICEKENIRFTATELNKIKSSNTDLYTEYYDYYGEIGILYSVYSKALKYELSERFKNSLS